MFNYYSTNRRLRLPDILFDILNELNNQSYVELTAIDVYKSVNISQCTLYTLKEKPKKLQNFLIY